METEMGGLPEEVREAVNSIDHVMWGRMTAEAAMLGAARSGPSSDWRTVRAYCVRITRENAELRRSKDTLALIAGDHGRALGNALDRAERAEAELAELKRKIAEAVKADVTVWYDGDEEHVELTSLTGIPDDIDDERVALLPLDDGGEG